MIIQLLLDLLYKILDILLVFEIPQLPPPVINHINTFFDYLVAGASVLVNYTPLAYLLVLFGVVLAVDAAIVIYHFVMWIIRKIPMLGMS